MLTPFLKLGLCRPRLEHDDVDIARPKFSPERFAQELVEGLRRSVDGVERQGLTPCDRARKKDATPPALTHALNERVGQNDGRFTIDRDETTKLIPV